MENCTKYLAVTAVTAIISLTGVTALTVMKRAPEAPASIEIVVPNSWEALASHFPECEYEYQNSCVWHAERSGNGEGRSFVALADGTIAKKPNGAME